MMLIANQIVRNALNSGSWDESKHPRSADGKFGSGGGGATSDADTPHPTKKRGQYGLKRGDVVRIKEEGNEKFHVVGVSKGKDGKSVYKFARPGEREWSFEYADGDGVGIRKVKNQEYSSIQTINNAIAAYIMAK